MRAAEFGGGKLRMAAKLKAVVDMLLTVCLGIVLLPSLPSLPSPADLATPTPPQLVALPVPTPSIPSVLPTPTPGSSVGAPQASAPASAAPASSQGGSVAQASSPPADQMPTHRVPIPFTAIYVSSPLDIALIGALMTLPLLLAIWLYLFLRTLDQARRARDAQTRLILAADLGLHPRDLASMSTKSLFSLREKAAFDELTGVLRRAVGIGVAEQAIARAKRLKSALSIAFIDVDNLKETNERNGRTAGDAMLCGLVQTLKTELRAEDIVFRYGGDEFVCLLPETPLKAARAKLSAIQADAARSGIRFCFGLAELTRSDDVVSLFARADTDLYEFKTKRGEIVQFPPAELRERKKDGSALS